MKCTLCEGEGKFEGYTCYKCGGRGEYLWIEEIVGIDPKKKHQFVKDQMEEEYLNSINLYEIEFKRHANIDVRIELMKRMIETFKKKKIIFDGGTQLLWIQLSPYSKRYSFDDL